MVSNVNRKFRGGSQPITQRIFYSMLFLGMLFSPARVKGDISIDKMQKMPRHRSESVIERRDRVCDEIFSPFHEKDRKCLNLLESRVTGIFGEYRKSYKSGHHHAGLDLKGDFNEKVHAIGFGWIVKIFRQFPHRSIIVEHRLPDGRILYSMYVHVEDIQVRVGDWVDGNTALARLFNEEELERANFGTANHLHLEIRKTFADRGRASYASMSMAELKKVCMDPLKFFREHLK